jgi:ADP-ribose pyrophosphatase
MKKIPDHAKKVFEGIVFDVYHWGQEQFDGSISMFEALRKRDNVTVIAVCDGKIAINHEEQPAREPFIGFPGGQCEKGENDVLSSAKRELLEETGLASDDWELLFISDPLNNQKIDWSNYFYVARNCKKVADQHLDIGEKIATSFITFEEFLDLRNNPMFRNKDINDLLTKVAEDSEERKKLQQSLGII